MRISWQNNYLYKLRNSVAKLCSVKAGISTESICRGEVWLLWMSGKLGPEVLFSGLNVRWVRGPLLRVECELGARPRLSLLRVGCEPTDISSSLSTWDTLGDGETRVTILGSDQIPSLQLPTFSNSERELGLPLNEEFSNSIFGLMNPLSPCSCPPNSKNSQSQGKNPHSFHPSTPWKDSKIENWKSLVDHLPEHQDPWSTLSSMIWG